MQELHLTQVWFSILTRITRKCLCIVLYGRSIFFFFSHINCSADCTSAVIDTYTDLWLGNSLPGLTFAERQFCNSQDSDFARCADWVFYRGLGCPRSRVGAGRACLRGTGCGGNGGCGLGWVSRQAIRPGFGSCQPRQNKTRSHILTCNI